MQFEKEQKVTLLVIAIVLLLASFFTWWVVSKQQAIRAADNPATRSFETTDKQSPYTDLSGNPLTLTDFVGEVIVVNSWASWSPASKQELQLLAKMTEEYATENVRILAINRGESKETAERYLRSFDEGGNILLVLDQDDRYFKSIEGYAMPETVFYDRSGNIVYQHRGAVTETIVQKYIEMAIQQSE